MACMPHGSAVCAVTQGHRPFPLKGSVLGFVFYCHTLKFARMFKQAPLIVLFVFVLILQMILFRVS